MLRLTFLLILAGLLAACSGTTVVLVPDPNGKVGEVTVSNDAGSTTLTKANESTNASKKDKAPGTAEVLSEKEVKEQFGDILAKEPIPPAHFKLYFGSGSAQMTSESEADIPKIAEAIKVRKSCDLSVIGHSDTVGDNKSNRGLSLGRANNVAKALVASGTDKNCMDIRYYGENDPAVRTADNVDEPLNRRVEVEIR